jgi:DnaK suppressor protein
VTDQPVDADRPDAPEAGDRDLERREQLEGEATNLETQLESLDGLDHGIEATTFDDNFADSGQVAAEMGENRALAAQLREQLDDVERALSKLDEGTYGKCEICGETIGAARLEAMPATRFCIDHAG